MGVFKRGKTWTARVFWRDQHKKRHSASQGGFKTKKEASDWFNDKNAELNKGINIGNRTYALYNYKIHYYSSLYIISKNTCVPNVRQL